MKYEYYVITKSGIMNHADFIDKMNALGSDGWELVSVFMEGDFREAYFKKACG